MTGEIVEVTGGAAGLAASYAAARELAATFAGAGDQLRELSVDSIRVARDPDLVASGLLAPVSCATAEAAVLALSTSAASASLGWEATAVAVRIAVTGLEEADQVVGGTLDRLLIASRSLLEPGLAPSLATDPGRLSEEPGLTGLLVAGLGGPITTLAASLAYGGPGRPVVAPYDARLPDTRPTDVRGLVEHLHAVAGLDDGTVEVQTLTDAEGGRRHVVYLPGTDDFNAPWDQGTEVRDLETDLDLAGRRPDPYTDGIREALHQAGVRPDEPVLLVGHSLGGMAAAALVAHPGGFQIGHVVTAGSPTAQVPGFPGGTHVLSLEQRGDIVPELDGAPNPDSVEQTTVLFDAHPADGILSHHGYAAYETGAALVDASADPSVAASVASVDAFLDPGADVTSQVFQITRAP